MSVHLSELARQVRQGTIGLLRDAPLAWLTWAPAGTSNHLLWHAGHAVWLQDCLCIEPLTGASELADGWAGQFGMNCDPVAAQKSWPARELLLGSLSSQLERMLQLFDDQAPRLQTIGPDRGGRWDLTRGVIHGLHDEARHQGEMYLLLKLRAAAAR